MFATHGSNVIAEIDWSPDGTYIASGGGSGTVRIWDALSGQQVFQWKGSGFLDWHPSDSLIVSEISILGHLMVT